MNDTLEQPQATSPSVQLRIDIVEATIVVFTNRGYRATTVEDVADQMQIPVEDVEREFPTWPGLVLAVIDRWNRRRLERVVAVAHGRGTIQMLRTLVAYNVAEPALMRLLVSLANEAADPTHPAAKYFRERYQDFHTMIQQGLREDIANGLAPDDIEPAAVAEQIVALYEGLQLQAMLRPRFDLGAAFNRAMDYFTDSW
ncbi:TetR/AcrR family transcriptional regulator [Frondihabitans australicus]|uniref:TetR family transcriptional regulator n=1 Tax=Frondihabitans australicus TaxID=386892 RepID=A0A495IHH7_9MICO|nr:TetR/AcrR family transcriptional regulator [Frondihabitans australicus]RKR75150.1 TetR family transcriptional regulator [Frondihabitans australicus]